MFAVFILLKFMKCLVYIMRGQLCHTVDATGITLNVSERLSGLRIEAPPHTSG